MASDELNRAITAVADSICDELKKYRANADAQPFSAVCLSIADDFTSAGIFGRTPEDDELEEWDVHSWMDGSSIFVDIEAFEPVIDDVMIGEEGTLPQCAQWLAALTLAMRLAKDRDAFVTDPQPAPYVYCSIADSEESMWLECRSGESLNAPESFSKISKDMAEYWAEEGNADPPQSYGNPELQSAYQAALKEIAGS